MFASTLRVSFTQTSVGSLSRSSRLFRVAMSNAVHGQRRSFAQYTSSTWSRQQSTPVGRRHLSSNGKDSTKVSNKAANSETVSTKEGSNTTALQRWLGHKEMPPRGTGRWYAEMVLLCTVFAITGTSTMMLVSFFCMSCDF